MSIIYGFIGNRLARDPNTQILRKQMAATFVLDELAENYFDTPIELRDTRDVHLSPNNTLQTENTIILDENKYSDFVTAYTAFSDDQKANIFNVIDVLFSKASSTSIADLEIELSTYPEYKSESISVSEDNSASTIFYVEPNLTITVPKYVRFILEIASVEYEFKFWFELADFKKNYPLTTISAVIPSTELDVIYNAYSDTAVTEGILSIVSTSTTAAQEILEVKLKEDDFSGYKTHKVRYHSQNRKTFLPFHVLYKGKAPGILEIRTAIKEYVLNSGVGDEEGWKTRIPELFIAAQFFLIPMWDHIKETVSTVLHPSIINCRRITRLSKFMMYDVDKEFIDEFVELATTPYNTMTVAVVPDPVNRDSRYSLLTEHPTYVDYASAERTGFNNMSKNTQQFSMELSAALSIADGVSNVEHTETIMDDRTFVSFTINDLEIHVLTEATYMDLLESFE